jgi:hypothetical protein
MSTPTTELQVKVSGHLRVTVADLVYLLPGGHINVQTECVYDVHSGRLTEAMR